MAKRNAKDEKKREKVLAIFPRILKLTEQKKRLLSTVVSVEKI